MSHPRESREEDAPSGTFTLARAAASGGMVAVVGAILLVSWMLRAEPRRQPAAPPEPPEPHPAAVPAPAPVPTLAPIVSAPEPEAPETPSSPLADRALRDVGRLAARRDAWTAQIAALCSEDSVAALVRSSGGSDRLYLLPMTISGRSCFRVLWGTYATQGAAASADLPATLRGKEKPRPIAVAGILP